MGEGWSIVTLKNPQYFLILQKLGASINHSIINNVLNVSGLTVRGPPSTGAFFSKERSRVQFGHAPVLGDEAYSREAASVLVSTYLPERTHHPRVVDIAWD